MDTERSLSWRDAGATLLVGLAVLVTAAMTNGWGWPVVGSNYRLGALALFVIGIGACITGGESLVKHSSDPFMRVARPMGGVAFLLLLGALIFNTVIFVVALGALIVAAWILATAHHVVTGVRTSRGRSSHARVV